MSTNQNKSQKNPFLPPEDEREEIVTGNASPYVPGVSLIMIAHRVSPSIGELPPVNLLPPTNPYRTVEEHFEATGLVQPVIPINREQAGDYVQMAREWVLQGESSSLAEGEFFPSEEKRGLFYRGNASANENLRKICNFFIVNLEVFSLKKTRDSEEIDMVSCQIFGHLKPIEVSFEEFEKIADWITKRIPSCQFSPSFMNAKAYFKAYAADCFATMTSHTLHPPVRYLYHGWERTDKGMRYLSAEVPNCEASLHVPRPHREDLPEIIRQGRMILEVGAKVYTSSGKVDLVASSMAMLPFFLYIHLSFAAKLFLDAGIDVQFLLMLVGPSGSLKTAVCKAFAEPFTEGDMLRFESTSAGLEAYREECFDGIMVVDDIFSTQKKATLAKFGEILRAFGDGIGRAKKGGAGCNELIRTKVRGGCIVTAEHSIDTQQSSALRFVELEVDRNTFDKKVLKEFQDDQRMSKMRNEPSIVQRYFGAWIGFLEEHYDEIVSLLRCYEPPAATFRYARHATVYRVFCAITHLVLRWWNEDGGIDIEPLGAVFLDTILAVMLRNQARASVSEPWQQVALLLQQGIGNGSIVLAESRQAFERDLERYTGYTEAKKGEELLVLEPTKTMAAIRRLAAEMGRELVADNMTIFRDLSLHGLSLGYFHKNGDTTRQRYLKIKVINGKRIEMLMIVTRALESTVNRIYEGGTLS